MKLTEAEVAAGLTPVQALARQVRRLRRYHPNEKIQRLLIRALDSRKEFGRFWYYIALVQAEVRRLDQMEEKREKPPVQNAATDAYSAAAVLSEAEEVPASERKAWLRLPRIHQVGTLAAARARQDHLLPADD